MSIKPENVNTSEEHVHETDISVPDEDGWVYLSTDDLHTLPIDWDALDKDALDIVLQLIMLIELAVKERNT